MTPGYPWSSSLYQYHTIYGKLPAWNKMRWVLGDHKHGMMTYIFFQRIKLTPSITIDPFDRLRYKEWQGIEIITIKNLVFAVYFIKALNSNFSTTSLLRLDFLNIHVGMFTLFNFDMSIRINNLGLCMENMLIQQTWHHLIRLGRGTWPRLIQYLQLAWQRSWRTRLSQQESC